MKDFKEYLQAVQEDIEIDLKKSEQSEELIAIYIDGKGYKKLSKNLTLKGFIDSYNVAYPNEKIDNVNGAKLTDTLGTLLLKDNKIEFSKVLKGTGPEAKTLLIYKK